MHSNIILKFGAIYSRQYSAQSQSVFGAHFNQFVLREEKAVKKAKEKKKKEKIDYFFIM